MAPRLSALVWKSLRLKVSPPLALASSLACSHDPLAQELVGAGASPGQAQVPVQLAEAQPLSSQLERQWMMN